VRIELKVPDTGKPVVVGVTIQTLERGQIGAVFKELALTRTDGAVQSTGIGVLYAVYARAFDPGILININSHSIQLFRYRDIVFIEPSYHVLRVLDVLDRSGLTEQRNVFRRCSLDIIDKVSNIT
jgi:hypothetical protein